jgi:hypothetical protein
MIKDGDKLAKADFTERVWGESSYSQEDGEPRRMKFLCESMPEALCLLFGGRSLGDLERAVYRWAGEGCPDTFSIEGKFLKTEGGWLEDLTLTLVPASEDNSIRVDGRAGDAERDYARDIISYLGLKR